MDDKTFYMQAAIAAMQGLQESGIKALVALDVLPKELAKQAFDIADAMLNELQHRRHVNSQIRG